MRPIPLMRHRPTAPPARPRTGAGRFVILLTIALLTTPTTSAAQESSSRPSSVTASDPCAPPPPCPPVLSQCACATRLLDQARQCATSRAGRVAALEQRLDTTHRRHDEAMARQREQMAEALDEAKSQHTTDLRRARLTGGAATILAALLAWWARGEVEESR